MAEPLKNLYHQYFITDLSVELIKHYPHFKQKAFINAVLNADWERLELKQRMRRITICLHAHLPFSYPEQIAILKKTAPAFTGFTAMFFPDFVEVYGLNDLMPSIDALTLFTQYSSSEFAVRPFIEKYPKQMLKQHQQWAKHKNHHVRRLASEGIRPRLPWAMALPEFKKDPSPIIPILELLKNDESEYVRKSVANCLNDISKDHPEMVIGIVNKWKGTSRETDWIIKHGSRGLLKQGNEQALASFGLNHRIKTEVNNFTISKKRIPIGGQFEFSFEVTLKEKITEEVRIEYKIYFMKANGKLSPKIFQVGTYRLDAKQTISFKRKHTFADLTTRKHHRGKHQISIVVNGKERATQDFELL